MTQSGDWKARIENRTVQPHQLIRSSRIVFETVPRQRYKIARQDTIEDGVADLSIIVSRPIGQTIQIRIIIVQCESESAGRGIIRTGADRCVHAVKQEALVHELGEHQLPLQAKRRPHTAFHERPSNDTVCRSVKNGFYKCPFETLRCIQEAVLARRCVEATLRGRTRRRTKVDRAMHFLMNANEYVARVQCNDPQP